jgi:hypothetical protein
MEIIPAQEKAMSLMDEYPGQRGGKLAGRDAPTCTVQLA